jgi:CheY-like chemotaxis protein
MPEMNGYAATHAIRAAERASGGHTPIIGVTAHALKGDREKCIEAGMDDYLSKPISPDRLSAKIGNWLSENGIARKGTREHRLTNIAAGMASYRLRRTMQAPPAPRSFWQIVSASLRESTPILTA